MATPEPEPEPQPGGVYESDSDPVSSSSSSSDDDSSSTTSGSGASESSDLTSARLRCWSTSSSASLAVQHMQWPARRPAFAKADDYDFDDWAQHAFGHMLTDFSFAMSDPDAYLDPAYLSKLKSSWVSLDPQRTGWLPFSQLPLLCDALVKDPHPISSWTLEPNEREAWCAAPADEILSLREFALMSERGEQYTRGEGDEDIARLQPGYIAPGPGVVSADAASMTNIKLVWLDTDFQVGKNAQLAGMAEGPATRTQPRTGAGEYAEYVDVCFSHLRNDCYSKADALRSATGGGWGTRGDWAAAMRSSSPDAGPPDWAEPGQFAQDRSAFYSAAWSKAMQLEANAEGNAGDSGWLGWGRCSALIQEMVQRTSYGPSCLRRPGGAEGLLQLRAAFSHAEWSWRMWSSSSAGNAGQLRSLWWREPEAFSERVSLRHFCLIMEQSDRLRPADRLPLVRFLQCCRWDESAHRLIIKTCGKDSVFVRAVRACLLAQVRTGTVAAVLPVELWMNVFRQCTPRCLD
jgi:hypothetical protein